MSKEIEPQESRRAEAYGRWMAAPQPMVTFFKTLNVSHLLHIGRKYNYKFQMLMCWCIIRAAAQMEEFYTLPAAETLIQYDSLAVSLVVRTLDGGLHRCEIPLSYSIDLFNRDYLVHTRHVQNTCEDLCCRGERMVIDTVAFPTMALDGIVAPRDGTRLNPSLHWGQMRRGLFRTTLPVSFQFHHAQMDEPHAMVFFDLLQKEINKVTRPLPPKPEPAPSPAAPTESETVE